ncbi:UDP-N-acetylmuramoylalanyl-D-glutamyl-2, 6-diaminopimelate--D-alanyl-D-alanyl ligase [Chlamydia felis Fe/C-56]|uniref:UDP-N-acetylmuramoyl-tripeptide--D-alanyl-D-alanine ligase n=1 Tax=Chlamydia felis (strain Fe/C-56) TaxID=264202 RepID=Q255W9_CHLFF|nr:UDP-N-acetylmuramoyl-tripeptide--D-alanyl-D-alanine ligase [Chlamydia felis]BAE80919.1 UDP-N-acetylmuramoylalanyl-D-glutamyl-2, 6-diaminopimelate--D-alanyl-D-alanyl ligase [Chlamydia felis Fe/C-56]
MQSILLEDWVSLMLSDVKYPRSGRKISGVAIDSRQVRPGDLFFALSGQCTDGHHFLKQAAQAGAVAAVVSKDYCGDSFGLDLVVVQDTTEALKEAGENQGHLFQGTIVGITGSIGKTTTKTFAKTFLSSVYRVYASPKSYNSQLTVPLSLLMADGDEDFIILEMGVSEPGNMRDLLSIVEPEISVITNIADQHAINFPDQGVRGIAEEKSHILQTSRIQLLPKDSPWYSHFIKQSPSSEKFSFAFYNETADFYYKAIQKDSVIISTPEGDVDFAVSFPYKPAYSNLLISFSLAWLLDVPVDRIIHSCSDLQLPPMRFELSMRNGIQVINDAYNACPEAMIAALDAIPNPSEGGKVILILGHMAELGNYSEEGHAIVANKALSKANIIFFIGEKWLSSQHLLKSSSCEVSFYPSAQSVEEILKSVVQQGDIVLLKGSRALALESLLSCF